MKQHLDNWQNRYRSPAYWIAVYFGSGLIRPAPGTWGSLAALISGYFLFQAGIMIFALSIVLVTIVGTITIDTIEKQTGIHDAPEIVIDEVAGMWISLLPFFFIEYSLVGFAFAFLFFRLFDIIKPWPIGWLDRHVSGGFGVMVDDIVAGLFAILSIGTLYTLLM